MRLDLSIGDRFNLMAGGAVTGVFSVEEDAEADPVVLRSVADDSIKHIARIDLAVLQASGRAIRTFKKGQVIRVLSVSEIMAFHEAPKKTSMSMTELKQWEVRRRDLLRAGRNLFYVQAWDANPVSRGEQSLEDFIAGRFDEAKEAGFKDLPSPSCIRKAIKIGERGRRTIALYLRKKGGARTKTKFPGWVYDLGEEMVAEFYRQLLFRYLDAHGWFDDRFYPRLKEWLQTDEGRLNEKWDLEPPCTQTLTNWINLARCQATLTMKYGKREASRRLRGRGTSLEPLAPLETIILDQTLAPIWAVEKVDLNGTTAIVLKRPWIVWAIDLYSRMVVGFIITFDPPCIATLMACLRHVISPKVEWIDRFGPYKGATDGFGSFYNVVLDNAKAHYQKTMKTVGDAAGFKITLAPIYTPEFKPWVERFNATMNGPLRTLPGGIPLEKDAATAEYNARASAALSVESIAQLLAHRIMEYHLDEHDGIGMAPARKWAEGLAEHDRPTVDDARAYKLLLGHYEEGSIGAEGIIFRGQQYHDPGITTMILNLLARLYSSRKSGKQGQSSRFPAQFIWQEMDTSSIAVVIGGTEGEIIELPNFDELHREKPVSFAFADGVRDYERRQNKQFHTREERSEARREYQKELEAILAKASHGDGKNVIRVLKGKEKLALGPGGMVLDLKAEASIDGREKPKGIPMAISLKDRVDPLVAQKGRKPRGAGKAAARKPEIDLPSVTPVVIRDDYSMTIFETSDDDALLDELELRHGY
ncbi:hypothetical protein ACC676_28390 [Rhizobium ruizarguesonis]